MIRQLLKSSSYLRVNTSNLNGYLEKQSTSAAYSSYSRTSITHPQHLRTSKNSHTSSKILDIRKSGSRFIKTAARQPGKIMDWPKITLLGDSITRRSFDPDFGCWGSLIAHRVNGYFDVDNRGTDGYNTRYALKYCPKLFPRSYLERVEILVFFYGHNDSWDPPCGVPLEEFNDNTRAIIKYLTENGLEKEKLIFITPTWYHTDDWLQHAKQLNYPNFHKCFNVCEKYSETILKIARDENIEVLDFFSISKNYEPLRDLFCDGIHLSRTGGRLLYDILMPITDIKIEARYGKQLVDLKQVEDFVFDITEDS